MHASSFLAALAGAAALSVATASHSQDAYPARTVTIISPYAQMSATSEPIVRMLIGKLSEKHKQRFIVEPRAGADGVIGMTAVARAKPDGYTLAFSNVGPTTQLPFLYKDVPYDPIRDFTPIAIVGRTESYILGSPALKAKDIAEVFKIAKERPGTLTYGVVGAAQRMNILKLENALGVKFLLVPYTSTGQIATALLSGTVDLAANAGDPVAISLGGKLRLLAINSIARNKDNPSVPAVAEFAPGFESRAWLGFLGPAGMPRDVVALLNRDINALLVTPEAQEIIARSRLAPAVVTPEEFAAVLKAEVESNAALVKKLNIVPE